MSIYEGRIAYFPNHAAASRRDLDFWVGQYREATADVPRDYGREHATAVLTFADELLSTTTNQTLAGMVTAAVERVDDAEAMAAKTLSNWEDMTESAVERYRLAWQSASQRARDILAALVESDEERHYLQRMLRERDAELAALVAKVAELSGITS